MLANGFGGGILADAGAGIVPSRPVPTDLPIRVREVAGHRLR
nr:hypothetical protein JVH1_6642 [Rhodococcus sp. JVH1]